MKQHMIGDNNKTLCGHDCTVQELRHQKKNEWRHVSCKRCHQQRYKVVHTINEQRGDHKVYI